MTEFLGLVSYKEYEDYIEFLCEGNRQLKGEVDSLEYEVGKLQEEVNMLDQDNNDLLEKIAVLREENQALYKVLGKVVGWRGEN